MPISIRCPHCAAYDSFPDAEAGHSVDCPACGEAIDLPQKSRPVAVAVVAQAKPIAAKPVAASKSPSKPSVDLDDEDDRPRKKSKPVVNLDDDPARKSKSESASDDGDRPRRKPRRRDDDEEPDDRPRRGKPAKSGGAMKILLILGVLGFVTLAVCGGAGVYFYTEWTKPVAGTMESTTATTVPTPVSGTKPTMRTAVKDRPKPDTAILNSVHAGDSFDRVSANFGGPGSDCTIADLQNLLDSFEFPATGNFREVLAGDLDFYAPWVAAGCGKLYRWDGGNTRMVVVYSGKPVVPSNGNVPVVKGAFLIPNMKGGGYGECALAPRDLAADADALRLGLKKWVDLKPEPERGPAPTLTPQALGEEFATRAGKPVIFKGVVMEANHTSRTVILAREGSGRILGECRFRDAEWAKHPTVRSTVEIRGIAESLKPRDRVILKDCRVERIVAPADAEARGRPADVAPEKLFENPAAWHNRYVKVALVAERTLPRPEADEPMTTVYFAAPAGAKSNLVGHFFKADAPGVLAPMRAVTVVGMVDAGPRGIVTLWDARIVTDKTAPAEVPKISALDLIAEIVGDRSAAAKKYTGVTIEVTGEVNEASGTGAIVVLKGGVEAGSTKPLLIAVAIKPDSRDAAKALQPGDTVTVVGILVPAPVKATSFLIKDGRIK